MRIMFMGTPDFAVSSLKALVESGENVTAVVTRADKPQGRGYKLVPPPVKVYAQEHGISVYQPATLKTDEFAQLLAQVDPELIVVAAYGRILPHNVIEYPKYGCINVHGSLLPEYRGAAPMQRAIIDGKKVTGITTMLMDDGLDTGDMLLTREVAVGPEDDFEIIHDRMAEAGAGLLLDTLAALRAGTLERHPQALSEKEATYAAKIEKNDCIIDFNLGAGKLHDLIRGLSPVPLALTHMPDGRMLKITKACISENGSAQAPGTVCDITGRGFTVACGDGSERIEVLAVLPEGKSRMSAADFIRGRRITAGDILG